MKIDPTKVKVRDTVEDDKYSFTEWLMDTDVLSWFPMSNLIEVEDAVRICMGYVKLGAMYTADYEGIPIGTANLYINAFSKIKHQSLFAITVRRDVRGKGVGTKLLSHLIEMSKERFQIELLHLEVYQNNPAIRMYEHFGFKEYGRHENFLKEASGFRDKILMQLRLEDGRT
jgi:putative acetyltransferase